MIKYGKSYIKNYMSMEYDFTGIRLQQGIMTPVYWNLSIDLIASTDQKHSIDIVTQNVTVAYQKLYYWLETNLPGTIMTDVSNEEDLFLSNLASNITMHCPWNPGDDLIVQLLHSKLSVLAKPNLIVSSCRLKGNDTTLRYSFGVDDGVYNLPQVVEEYYTDCETRDTIPWWMRDDGFSFEIEKSVDQDEIIDPMTEFYSIIDNSNIVEEEKTPAKIIKFEKWKPKKVE